MALCKPVSPRGVQSRLVSRKKMNILDLAEKTIRGQWTGARFHYDGIPAGLRICEDPRACEALAKSFEESVTLPAEYIYCPGARRSLGLANGDDALAEEISEEAGMDLSTVLQAIKDAPRLANPVTAITLGCIAPLDVVLGYLQPRAVMHLVRRWHQVYGVSPRVKLSGFMTICGNALVAAHVTQKLCLSFGCRESRKHGGVADDMLVVGMPHSLAVPLFQENH